MQKGIESLVSVSSTGLRNISLFDDVIESMCRLATFLLVPLRTLVDCSNISRAIYSFCSPPLISEKLMRTSLKCCFNCVFLGESETIKVKRFMSQNCSFSFFSALHVYMRKKKFLKIFDRLQNFRYNKSSFAFHFSFRVPVFLVFGLFPLKSFTLRHLETVDGYGSAICVFFIFLLESFHLMCPLFYGAFGRCPKSVCKPHGYEILPRKNTIFGGFQSDWSMHRWVFNSFI